MNGVRFGYYLPFCCLETEGTNQKSPKKNAVLPDCTRLFSPLKETCQYSSPFFILMVFVPHAFFAVVEGNPDALASESDSAAAAAGFVAAAGFAAVVASFFFAESADGWKV